MFQPIAARLPLVQHLARRAASGASTALPPSTSPASLLLPTAQHGTTTGAGLSLRERQPRAALHVPASAGKRPLPEIQAWHARASQLESEDVFAYLSRSRVQRQRESELLRPPRPSLAGDPVITELLEGKPPQAALDTLGQGVRCAIELLAPRPGHRIVFSDPTDLRACVLLAAHGCHCVVSLSDFRSEQQLREELQPWKRAAESVEAVGTGASRAREVVGRIHLVQSPASSLQPPFTIPSLPAGSARGVVSLLTSQRHASADAAARGLQSQAAPLEPGGGVVFDLLHAAGAARLPTQRPPLLLSLADLQPVLQDQGLRLAYVWIEARPLADDTPPAPGRTVARRAGSAGIEPGAADQAAWDLWRQVTTGLASAAVPVEVRVSGLMTKAS